MMLTSLFMEKNDHFLFSIYTWHNFACKKKNLNNISLPNRYAPIFKSDVNYGVSQWSIKQQINQ